MFNWSQCFPEILVSILSTFIIARTENQASVLGLGGACAFLGAVYIIVRRVGAAEFGLGNVKSPLDASLSTGAHHW